MATDSNKRRGAYGDFWEIIEDDATTALHNIYAWMPLPEPYRAELRFSEEELERQVKECVDKIVVRCVDCKYQDTCYKSVTVRTRRGAELKACSAGRRKDEGEEELSDER